MGITITRVCEDKMKTACYTKNMPQDHAAELEKVVSKLSHDIRNPLTSSKLNVDLLLQGVAGPLTDQQKEMLRDIDAAQTKILELIQEFRNSLKK
jgi:signal transduction histidine kinase